MIAYGMLIWCLVQSLYAVGNPEWLHHYCPTFRSSSLEIPGASASEHQFEWAIIGGGPAGIITVAVLLELGIDPSHIVWIDAEFAVGRLGKHYGEVPANNKAKRFIEFIELSKVLKGISSPAIDRLYALDPEKEYPLQVIIDPLQDITDHFLKSVPHVRGYLNALEYHSDSWTLLLDGCSLEAQRVVLALGSHPRDLSYSNDSQKIISLDDALRPSVLLQQVKADDTVAVFGGAHSAVLIMKWLSEMPVARIINFYRQPLQYPSADVAKCTMQGDILSGVAAAWARDVLDSDNPPSNIVRVKTSDASLRSWLPLCTKIIYAAGYERNDMPAVSGVSLQPYDVHTGIIGTHLFGIGIAFPEFVEDHVHNTCKFQIGLLDFMKFAQRMLPEWMHKDISEAALCLVDVVTVTVL